MIRPEEMRVKPWSAEKGESGWNIPLATGAEVVHVPTGKRVTCDRFRDFQRNLNQAVEILETMIGDNNE